MSPIHNPFSPGAGSPPPELVGRDGVMEQARVLLGRIRIKRSEKSMLLTGLRGVGKTVLLKLIKKGMIYSPAHGDIDFTVPLFDEFMRRAIPNFKPHFHFRFKYCQDQVSYSRMISLIQVSKEFEHFRNPL